jgi:hypothetical protein
MTPNFLVFLLEHLKGEEGSKRSPQKKEKKKRKKKNNNNNNLLKNILLQKFKHVVDKEEV